MTATARAEPPAASRDRWFEKAPGSPLERFPALGEAFIAAARVWTDSFCALSASPGELVFKGLRSTTVGELGRPAEGLPIFAALKVPAWDCPAALSLTRPLVSTVIEAFFGGGDEEDQRGDTRPVSPVEIRIVDVIGGQAATALTGGFKEFGGARFEFERTLGKPELKFLGREATPLLAVAFEIRTVGRAVLFDVALPLGALDAQSEALGGGAVAGPVPDASRWAVQLKAEVARASMRLSARIDMHPTTLGAIADWRVGAVIELPTGSGHDVLLTCEDEVLFRCDLGQSAGRYTVRIGERSSAELPRSRKDD